MKRYTYYIIIALLTLLTSCGDTEYEYSGYPAYFIFENNAGRSAALASAMNAQSPGIFCRITLSSAASGEHGNRLLFNFASNQGLSDVSALSAIDEQRTIQLGVYNMTGIIVGFGNLDNPPTFYAYDSQCPNCYKNTNLPRFSLSMNTDGTAECGNCHRKYDMNNNGLVVNAGDSVVVDGEKIEVQPGDRLIRYHASTTGPQGVLSVTN